MHTRLASAAFITLSLLMSASAIGQEQREKLPPHNANLSSLRDTPPVALKKQTDAAMTVIQQQSERLPSDPLGRPSSDLSLPDTSSYGEFTIERRVFYDSERDRSVATVIYVPVRATIAAPVLVFAEGGLSSATDFAELSEHLASRGFAVAVIERSVGHRSTDAELSSFSEVAGVQADAFIERPRDVSFLLDELKRVSRSSRERFGIEIDLKKVGVVGHSFGGYTALALAGAQLNAESLSETCQTASFISYLNNPSLRVQCSAQGIAERFNEPLKDERVRAVMAINPMGSRLFGDSGLSQVDVPVLMVAGSEDSVAPALLEPIEMFAGLEHPQAQPVVALVRGRDDLVVSYPQHYLAVIEGGNHLYALPDGSENDASVAGDLVTEEVDVAYDYLRALSIAFLNPEVAEYDGFRRGLTRDALQLLSQPALPLHVVGYLTEDMLGADNLGVVEP